MCRCLTLFCLVLLTLGFAPGPVFKPKQDQKGTDLQRLQGTWIGPKGLEARFEKDRLTYFRNGKLVTVYQVIVNASTEPKSIDLVGVAGGADDGRTYLIIYRLGVNTFGCGYFPTTNIWLIAKELRRRIIVRRA